jgi:hypothetical protein
MTWYDVKLETEDLLRLQEVFGQGKFSIENSQRGFYLANYSYEGKEVSVMAYNEKMVTIFQGAVGDLPKDVQTEIRKKLSSLTVLEKIAQEV